MNKKALSPLVATIILIVFSLIVGTITMKWGEGYMQKISAEESEEVMTEKIIIDYNELDTELKKLQISHIKGEISQREYLEEEKKLI